MAAEVVPRALTVAETAGIVEASRIVANSVEAAVVAGAVATAVELAGLVEAVANFAEERAVGVVGTAWKTSELALLDRERNLSIESSQCLTAHRTFK